MASCKEISRLVTNMNLTTGSGRPSRNSQGICNTPLQPTMPSTLLPETPVNTAKELHTPVTTPVARSIPSDSNSSAVMDTSNSNTPVPITMQDREVEVLTPCTRQHDKFVDPAGRPLQPGTVIFCDDLPFIVSANSKICNYTGGNMEQLYVADPSEHKLLVNEANRPGTLSNILESVLGMLPGFWKKQNNALHNTKEIEEQTQATPEALTIDTTSNLEIDIVNFHANVSAQNDTYSSDLSPIPTKTMLQTHHVHNEMSRHYNHIVVGCF